MKFLDILMTVLPFSQWRAGLQLQHWSCYSHGYAVWSGLDLLPSQPPPYSPRHQATTWGMSLIHSLYTYSLSALCPLSVPAWVILSLRRCSWAVTGIWFVWYTKLQWIDPKVIWTRSSYTHSNARITRHKNNRSDSRARHNIQNIFSESNILSCKHSAVNSNFNYCWQLGEKS